MLKYRFKNALRKVFAATLSASMVLTGFAGFMPNKSVDKVYAGVVSTDNEVVNANKYELVDNVQDAAILHCWNWSYATIEQHLELIAECGYSAIQTSPATQPKDYKWKGEVGMEVGIPGKGSTGNWWKVYQPVSISVCDNGETWFGTKAELESLCEKAEEYGIKVIVDIVANHMGNITGWQNSLTDVSPQVGEFWNPDMMTDESYWHINDLQVWMSDGRRDITQGSMGMPDLNTGDSRVQKYFETYLKELIDCGVDGFRFDAAKHIETPDDDPSYASYFWPNVLNPAESYYTQKTGGDLYVYGEILNTVGDGFSINSYTKYMSVTDNSAGNQCLDSFRNNQIGSISMHHPVDKSLLWAESHDTYMNESSRYGSDKSIVRTWSYVANKNGAAALYFVRPYYSKDTLTGDVDGAFRGDLETSLEPAIMGECSTYTWASNEVAAINHFRNRMKGQAEYYGSNGNVGYCRRGNGVILVNMSGAGSVSVNVGGLSNGTYTDEVSGNTFTVSGGTVSGTIGSDMGIAVIYQNVMPNPSQNKPVTISTSLSNGSTYYTNGLTLTVTAKNATSATYTASTGESGSFTESKEITIGKGLKDGEKLTLTVKATNSYGTVTKTFTYTKDSKTVEITADKADGSKFYTDTLDVTIEAVSATTATYSASTGEKGSFTGSTTVTIGAGLSAGQTVTLTVTGTNDKGTVTKTFTYTKSDDPLGTAVLFKNTAGWTTVNAYAWNSETDKMSTWPGTKMTVYDAANNIYMIEFTKADAYKKIIFNNGSAQTADLTIPGMGYIYDYSTSKWSQYETPVSKPTITSTLASGEVTGATQVTFTVKDATSATYSVNGGSAVSFTNNITLTIGNNETDTVVITATNSSGTTTKTYTYTCEKEEALTASASLNKTSVKVGETVTITATANGGSGNYTYTYKLADSSLNTLKTLASSSSSNTYTWTATSDAVGSKYLVVTVSDGSTTKTVNKAITVNAAEIIVITKPTVTVAAGDGQVKVSWNAVSGATKYQVCSYLGGKYTVRVNNYTGTSYTVTGLTNGTKYGFLVRAYGNGAWTTYTTADLKYATPQGTTPITKPTVTVAAGNGQVKVSWNAVSGATKYQVCSYIGGKYTVRVNNYTGTSYTVTGLTNGTNYGFLVRAYGNGAWTTYTTADLKYATPQGTTPITKPTVTLTAGNGQVKVSWNAVSGATKYQVCSYIGGKYTVRVNNYTGTSYTVTGLTNGTKYGFLVRAYGNGAWTTYSTADLKYATPSGSNNEVKPVVAALGDNKKVMLSWSTVPGATKYQVCSYVGGKYTVQVNNYTGTSYTVTGLTNGTKYGFLVRAYVNGVWTSYSTADLVYATPSL